MNDFNLFIYKKVLIDFQKVIYTYFIKTIYYKISIWQQKLFLFAFIKKKEWIFTTLFTKVSQFDFYLQMN